MCADALSFISLIVGIISVILGVFSIILSLKFNEDSNKVNRDTRKMLEVSIMYQELLQQNFNKNQFQIDNKINLNKDEIQLIKLSSYKNSNADNIIRELEKLSIKKHTLDYLYEFLISRNEECEVNFFNEAKTKDNSNLRIIIKKLLE